MDEIHNEIRALFKTNEPLSKPDLVSILFQLLERIQQVEAKLKEKNSA
jgi:hypothetical protein